MGLRWDTKFAPSASHEALLGLLHHSAILDGEAGHSGRQRPDQDGLGRATQAREAFDLRQWPMTCLAVTRSAGIGRPVNEEIATLPAAASPFTKA